MFVCLLFFVELRLFSASLELALRSESQLNATSPMVPVAPVRMR